MSNDGVNSDALLSNPALSPLIDHDEPAPESKEKPAPAAEEQKTDIPDATDENAETQESKEADEERKQSRRQRKLERERDARIRAETRAEIAERELARTKASPQEPGEPQREQFEDYESYLRAITRYDAAQEAAKTLKADREAFQQREARSTAQSAEQKVADDWTKREKEYIAKAPTFEEDVNNFLEDGVKELSGEARRAIVELGPEILHYLATHEDEVEEIAKLSPLRQVAALGRIDTNKAETSGDVSGVQSRKPPPPPAKHVRGGNSAPAALSDDMSSYIEQRKKQGARWARH
jgi:hypothetical protein